MTAEPRWLRGDVWLTDLGADPSDPEQAFVRPALIVSDDRMHRAPFGMIVIVPATPTVRDLPLHVVAQPDSDNGLTVASAFQSEQVRSVSTRRLRRRLGSLGAADRHAVDEMLRAVLKLY